MILKTYSVQCDDQRSPNCVGWVSETIDGATEARREALLHGWKREGGKDICPNCQASGPVAVAPHDSAGAA